MKFTLLQSSWNDNGFQLASECFQKKQNALLTQSELSADNNDTALLINKLLT